jgi:hypothetical protein
MALCKDPSVTFLNKFGYNVVRLPRTGIEPMDVLGKRGSLERLGRLSSVWKTTRPEPPVGAPSRMVDIEGQKSDKLELSVGLKLLSNALQGLGAPVPSLDGAFQRARKVQFHFTNVTSTSVSPLEAGNYLASGDLDTANPLVAPYFLEEDGDAFLIVDVLKSDAVTVQATNEHGAEVKVDIPALQQVVGVNVGVKTSGASESIITFQGQTPITFGFKAFAIGFANGRWSLAGTKASGDMAFAIPAGDGGEEPEPFLFSTSGLVGLRAA